MDLERYIDDLVLDLPSGDVARSLLDQDYLAYCQSQSQMYEGYEKELENFLVICGYVTAQVVDKAFQDHPSKTPMLSKEIILSMESYKGGALINLGESYLKEAYQALVRWWKRLCQAVKKFTRLAIEKECAAAIALSADLALAKYA